MAVWLNPLNSSKDLGDPQLQIRDPKPNIDDMFRDFDKRFFDGTLVNNNVTVAWSNEKMTRRAGQCTWKPKTRQCEIKLSRPSLQLRSRKDLVQSLIHEMIHALLFVTHKPGDRPDKPHGRKFQQHMNRINQEANLKISVYHTFLDEVRQYQTHVWVCTGACKREVRRSMNRKPGPADHRRNCGGVFVKVSEPVGFGKRKLAKKPEEKPAKKNKENEPVKELVNEPAKEPEQEPVKENKENEINEPRSIFNPTKSPNVSDQPSISCRSNSSSSAVQVLQNVDSDLEEFKRNANELLGYFGLTLSPNVSDQPSTSFEASANAIISSFRSKQSIVLDSSRSRDRARPFDAQVVPVSPPSKRKCLGENITLSDDDEDLSWLDEVTDEQLLGNTEPPSKRKCLGEANEPRSIFKPAKSPNVPDQRSISRRSDSSSSAVQVLENVDSDMDEFRNNINELLG